MSGPGDSSSTALRIYAVCVTVAAVVAIGSLVGLTWRERSTEGNEGEKSTASTSSSDPKGKRRRRGTNGIDADGFAAAGDDHTAVSGGEIQMGLIPGTGSGGDGGRDGAKIDDGDDEYR